MPIRRPDVLPSVVPLEQMPEVSAIEDTDMEVDPEARVFASDHRGVVVALELLPSRQRQILREKVGLNESGVPLSRAEIAEELGLSIETVSSALTRARNRLRAVGNILSVINGECLPSRETDDNPLQTS